jgi:osmotically-inducible protein OsmY
MIMSVPDASAAQVSAARLGRGAGRGLDVRVRHGAAHIGGLTFDASVRDEATQIARNVPGVTQVVNEIEVSAGSGGY